VHYKKKSNGGVDRAARIKSTIGSWKSAMSSRCRRSRTRFVIPRPQNRIVVAGRSTPHSRVVPIFQVSSNEKTYRQNRDLILRASRQEKNIRQSEIQESVLREEWLSRFEHFRHRSCPI
jgi:hypothetical protein